MTKTEVMLHEDVTTSYSDWNIVALISKTDLLVFLAFSQWDCWGKERGAPLAYLWLQPVCMGFLPHIKADDTVFVFRWYHRKIWLLYNAHFVLLLIVISESYRKGPTDMLSQSNIARFIKKGNILLQASLGLVVLSAYLVACNFPIFVFSFMFPAFSVSFTKVLSLAGMAFVYCQPFVCTWTPPQDCWRKTACLYHSVSAWPFLSCSY